MSAQNEFPVALLRIFLLNTVEHDHIPDSKKGGCSFHPPVAGYWLEIKTMNEKSPLLAS